MSSWLSALSVARIGGFRVHLLRAAGWSLGALGRLLIPCSPRVACGLVGVMHRLSLIPARLRAIHFLLRYRDASARGRSGRSYKSVSKTQNTADKSRLTSIPLAHTSSLRPSRLLVIEAT